MIEEIVNKKKKALGEIKSAANFSESYENLIHSAETMTAPVDFFEALSKKGQVNIITELKKASPSKGLIREDFNYLEVADVYEKCGAVAISVLTEENYFLGSLDYLKAVKEKVSIPVLRKDFLFDDYHVYEARAAGADTLLLIVNMLSDSELGRLITLSRALKMEPLVEVHTEEEMTRALKVDAAIIGINNRDLNTFETDINNTIRIMNVVDEIDKQGRVFISESGINSFSDIERLTPSVNAFLIGESLMREKDIALKLNELLGK